MDRRGLGWPVRCRLVNFGPGDTAIAHTKDEHVTVESIDEVFGAPGMVTIDGEN